MALKSNILARLAIIAATLVVFAGCDVKQSIKKSKRSAKSDLNSSIISEKAGSSGTPDIFASSCQQTKNLYQEVWLPVFEATCTRCHTAEGQANFSAFKLLHVSSVADFANNMSAIKAIADKKTPDGQSLLIAKPTLTVAHGGGQIFPVASKNAEILRNFIQHPPSDKDVTCLASGEGPEIQEIDPVLDDRNVHPTRLARRLSLAVRGRLPNLDEYKQLAAAPESYPGIVDSWIKDAKESEVLYDRAHARIMRSFLPDLVREPYTLGSDMLGMGVEFRNQIATNVLDPHNPLGGRVWNTMLPITNKSNEPRAGCRIDYLKDLPNVPSAQFQSPPGGATYVPTTNPGTYLASPFEYYVGMPGYLSTDLTDCVLEAPMKALAMDFKRYLQPGFSANFGPGHPRWAQRQELSNLMTQKYAISQENPIDHPNIWRQAFHGITATGLSKPIAADEDLPWARLKYLESIPNFADEHTNDFWSRYPNSNYWTSTAQTFPHQLLSRPSLTGPIGYNIADVRFKMTRGCQNVENGPLCNFVDQERTFLSMLHWVPPVDVYPDIYRPGFFSGCLTPRERFELNKISDNGRSFWQEIKDGRARPPLDTAVRPIVADALDAVAIRPWWNPDKIVYACPGLAIELAAQQQIIERPPYFATKDSASHYTVNNQIQTDVRFLDGDRVGKISYEEFILVLIASKWSRQHGNYMNPIAACSNKSFRSAEWRSCVRANIHPDIGIIVWPFQKGYEFLPTLFQSFGSEYRASPYHVDTYFNPLADCGLNLRLCNPYHGSIAILASLEAHALFYHVLKNDLPWKSFFDAPVRLTNRILEWARYYTEIEAAAIVQAVTNGQAKSKGYVGDPVSMPFRFVAGTWTAPDIMSVLSGAAVTPQLEWFDFETSPAKLNGNVGIFSAVGRHEVYADRHKIDEDGFQFNKKWLTWFSPKKSPQGGAPAVGVLSTSTFLNLIPRDRSRANRALQMATCEGFPAAVGSFQAVPEESNLAPRLREKSGCAQCHNEGGVDPMARFFMGYAGSRVAEIDGNHNFSSDKLNFWDQPNSIPGLPAQWLPNQPMGLLNFGYMSEQTVMSLNPQGYYGRGKDGTTPDTWKGHTVTEGLRGLASVLTKDSRFTRCAVQRVWNLMLSRNPTYRERLQVEKITKSLNAKGDFTLSDAIRAVALSDAFKKDN